MKKPALKTIDIEIVLMRHFDIRANIIVPNVSWGIWSKDAGTLHECDLIVLSGKSYATEIEIKISRTDLLKDKGKWHNHQSNHIRRLYFAVPEKLKELALKKIPERAGLIIIKQVYDVNWGPVLKWRNIVEIVRKCKTNTSAVSWTDEKKMQLARLGTMRILGLKEKIIKLNN